MSDRPIVPSSRASARNGRNRTMGRDNGTTTSPPGDRGKVIPTASDPRPSKGTLGGSNRLLSSRDVATILAIPERTVRDKWKEWGLPAYRIGKHLRWRERDVYAWIERQAA
jgi:excisionase family DNA binding protein